MSERSFIGAGVALLFAFAGFISQGITILLGTDARVVLHAFIYITPLLIDTMDDLTNFVAVNRTQYLLDRVSFFTGISYLAFVLVLFILQTEIDAFQLQGFWLWFVKCILLLPPVIFVARTGYSVILKLKQNNNIAELYYPVEESIPRVK